MILTPTDAPLTAAGGTGVAQQLPPLPALDFDVSGWHGCLVIMTSTRGVAFQDRLDILHFTGPSGSVNVLSGFIKTDTVGMGPNNTAGGLIVYVPYLGSRVRFAFTGHAQTSVTIINTNRLAGRPMHTPNKRGRPAFSNGLANPLTPFVIDVLYCGEVLVCASNGGADVYLWAQARDPATGIDEWIGVDGKHAGGSGVNGEMMQWRLVLPPWTTTLTWAVIGGGAANAFQASATAMD